jgi:hypothetical protein
MPFVREGPGAGLPSPLSAPESDALEEVAQVPECRLIFQRYGKSYLAAAASYLRTREIVDERD